MAHWEPSAAISVLKTRARLLARIRDFFNQREYFEVETPVIAHAGITDVYLTCLTTGFRGETLFLQTSPEYHMKRLLAAGSGPIFQICKSFRDDELGRFHNPEFTMLEWYKPGADFFLFIEEVSDLLTHILQCPPMIKKTYRALFHEICDIDPFIAPITVLQSILEQYDLGHVLSRDETDRDVYLFLLMSHVIEPELMHYEAPVAVYDFPASQASLALVTGGVAKRFEVYFKGVELANGFEELTDPRQQRQRFISDNIVRAQKGIPEARIDEFLLQALEHGLPPTCGVALGIDRLLMQALQCSSISEVLAFDILRA